MILFTCVHERGRYLEIGAEKTVNYREISGEINDVKNYPNYLATQDQLMFNKYNTGARESWASSGGETLHQITAHFLRNSI